MPSKSVTKSRYRKAQCCGNCSHEDRRYCNINCMPVTAECICDTYDPDPKRAPCETKCKDCRFGMRGDHSCAQGCEKGGVRMSCFAGRVLPQ